MSTVVSRRRFLTHAVALPLAGALGAAFALRARRAWAEEMVHIEESDPLASAFGYAHDATKVDVAKFPKRAGEEGAKQFCHNCAVYMGDEGAEWGPCAILPGKLVKAGGWCNAWAEG
jgi:hypothetical protein